MCIKIMAVEDKLLLVQTTILRKTAYENENESTTADTTITSIVCLTVDGGGT